MAKYPKDLFDSKPASVDRIGAHRAGEARSTRMLYLLIGLGSAAVIVIAGVIIMNLIRNNNQFTAPVDTANAQQTEAPVETPPTNGEPPAETTEPPAETPAETPGTEGEGAGGDNASEPTPTPEATDEAPVLDRADVNLSVLNSTSISGIAGDQAALLADAGYVDPNVGNATGGALRTTTVYYGSADLEAAALRLVADVAETSEGILEPVAVLSETAIGSGDPDTTLVLVLGLDNG